MLNKYLFILFYLLNYIYFLLNKYIFYLKYLGCLLRADGDITGELRNRIGQARGDFNSLVKVWKHTSVARKTKLAVFNQCIVSKLLYGLEGAWLLNEDKKTLDAFHIKCLRKINGVSYSWIGRVRNQYILDQNGTVPLSMVLLRRQCFLFGKIARIGLELLIRGLIFMSLGGVKDLTVLWGTAAAHTPPPWIKPLTGPRGPPKPLIGP